MRPTTSALISIHTTQRKAINAARKAYGACRYGDVASVHRSGLTFTLASDPLVGYVVCPREYVLGFTGMVRKAAGFLINEAATLVYTYHDSMKG